MMVLIQSKYDVIVIGSGPSGCACALRCGQLGLKTLCIDNLETKASSKLSPGIVSHPICLEITTLLESANRYYSLIMTSENHGINFDTIKLDLSQMMERKKKILKKISQNTVNQFSSNNIDFINGKAKLLAPGKIELINYACENNIISASHIVLATESTPIPVQCAPIDNNHILDSSSALNITTMPKKLAILGAGVLGLELAGIWNKLGADTILFDAQESFLSLVDHQISREAYKIFTQQGLDIRLGTRVLSTKIIHNQVLVEYQDIEEGIQTIQVDKLFVASGRKPGSENLAAPEANLFIDSNGYVLTDENYHTNLPNVYAIGDLTLYGPMLPHKGIAEGECLAEAIANYQKSSINYQLIPNVIHTSPEIAWIGQSELSLNTIGHPTQVSLLYFDKNIKATSKENTEGIIKIICCAQTDTILGIQIICDNASELIAHAALAMEFSANAEDIIRTIYPYPSFADIFSEGSKLLNQ